MLPDSILPVPEDDVARILEDYKKRISHLETLEQAGAVDISARVFNSAAITIANNAFTALTFDSENYDTDGIHNPAVNPSRLTAQTAGKYIISGSHAWDANVTGNRYILFRVNATFIASVLLQATSSGGGNTDMALTALYELAVGDFVEMVVRQTSGGNLDIQRNNDWSPWFGMHLTG